MLNGRPPSQMNMLACISILFAICCAIHVAHSAVAPILDIENEAVGYLGTIGERNVLVDLKPHLQIKNIDAINGICSYHVFKPNSEEFPFTIDIKDKTTGEAVIEVIRREVEASSDDPTVDPALNQQQKQSASSQSAAKNILLDCNKRKVFNFLIQAHDCSTPSLPSNKVPVQIQVIDHDDYVLKFEESGVYAKKMAESEEIYENFLSIKAHDEDCTNDGNACAYILLSKDSYTLDSSFAFRIDQTSGQLSSTRGLKSGELFEFKVRAFDCVNNASYVDAPVYISIVEKCTPQWTNYPVEILSTLESTYVFDTISATSCEQKLQNVLVKPDSVCQVDSVDTKVVFNLDPSIKNNCAQKCAASPAAVVKSPISDSATQVRTVLFSGSAESSSSSTSSSEDNQDDDNIEDDENEETEENKVVPAKLPESAPSSSRIPPSSFVSFSKEKSVRKIDFDGKFSDNFVLSAWLRRPASAEKSVKEHVFCGTDSKNMNRHHFGLYFYRGNLKFLLRRESSHGVATAAATDEVFYPSLWEWTLYEPLLSDAKWHYYEIKFNYPNATLYIDGVKFFENTTNSDIIDAYELSDAADVGSIVTYVGACYHARTQSLIDHFEGDIGSVALTKPISSLSQAKTDVPKVDETCKTICNEIIEINALNWNSNIQSTKSEISLKAKSLNEMRDLLQKVAYVNKDTYPRQGARTLKLTSSLKCSNMGGRTVDMKPLEINIKVKSPKREYDVKLEGDKQLFATKLDLENGIEPFKDISISKILLTNNRNDDSSSSSSEEIADEISIVKFSKCQIKISPDRNLMAPALNNEKVMFLQNLLDEFGLKFEETLSTVLITGVKSVENYETFLRRLTYVIMNINDVDPSSLALIRNKKFYITCTRDVVSGSGDAQSTNTILVQVNLTQEAVVSAVPGFIAMKQMDRQVLNENDGDLISERTVLSALVSDDTSASNPLIVAVVVMSVCAVGFLGIFALVKIHASRSLFSKRKLLPNEENPQMEWDDSGLNITENPLDTLEINKECLNGKLERDEFTSSDEEEEEEEEEEEGVNQGEEEEDDDEEEDEEEEGPFSSEEEPDRKIIDRELEWDDTSLELKLKDKQLKQQQQLEQLSAKLSNKSQSTNNFNDPNKFV